MPLLRYINGHAHVALARLLRALALAARIRTAGRDAAGDGEARAELDRCRDWLAARAQDAPGNYRTLLLLVDAERAWGPDDAAGGTSDGGGFRAARAFDAAQRSAGGLSGSWQRALVLERTARFHLAHGLEHAGNRLLAEARAAYRQWGATAKVHELDRQFPQPAAVPGTSTDASYDPAATMHRAVSLDRDTIDLLAVLEASRALSSETSLHRLTARVSAVLKAMTGATTVQVLLADDGSGEWLPVPTDDDTPDSQAGAAALPLSVLRYVGRTHEALLVEDATTDDRFAGDPYLTGLQACSLLAVPILGRGTLRAVLVLENRLGSAAFAADRLDTVQLIAGQLAVSLDNALLYASLEEKVALRTEELNAANAKLELLSATDPLTGLANRRRMTDVLDAEWRRALRTHEPLAVAMIDVDHFKLYNDHYGHLAGDDCLRRVATALARHVRGSDLAARYGGEEFALILSGADTDAARGIAERVRTEIEASAEPHPLSTAGHVTVSIGVAAVIPTAHSTAAALLNAADAELYRAKHRGRNRVAG
jgi:diguanylate cyclase (GGDEF)-like protein